MGACFDSRYVNVESDKEAVEVMKQIMEDDCYENGHKG